jgi:hypothetical protein
MVHIWYLAVFPPTASVVSTIRRELTAAPRVPSVEQKFRNTSGLCINPKPAVYIRLPCRTARPVAKRVSYFPGSRDTKMTAQLRCQLLGLKGICFRHSILWEYRGRDKFDA